MCLFFSVCFGDRENERERESCAFSAFIWYSFVSFFPCCFCFYNQPFICSSDIFSSIMKTRTEIKVENGFYVCGPINNDKSLANRSEHVRHAFEIILKMLLILSWHFIVVASLLFYMNTFCVFFVFSCLVSFFQFCWCAPI